MTRKILYLGNFSFPNGNAAGSRVLNNGYLLRELGFEVIYIGLDKDLATNSSLESTKQTFDGFRFYNLPYPQGNIGWLLYKTRFSEVISLVSKEDLNIVILYSNPTVAIFGHLIKNWCKKNKIKFIIDSHDWLPAESGGLVFRLVKYIDTIYQFHILASNTDGIIAISSFLSDFHRSKGRKTVIIPPLVNIANLTHLYTKNNANKVVSLIYVGQPFPTDGRIVKKASYKDRLDKIIEILNKFIEFEFEFNIYGLTKEQYLYVIPGHITILNELEHKIKFHGYVSNGYARSKVSEADFTILFRDNNRMTKAGFPTKIVESISCGTPVITTNTSDLNKYLEIGKNGYFVDIDDKVQLFATMNEIFKLDRKTINLMKKYCRESELFSYQKFKSELNYFINSL